MDPDTLDTACAEGLETVLILEPAELALDSCAAYAARRLTLARLSPGASSTVISRAAA